MTRQQFRVYVCHGPTCGPQARPIWNAAMAEVQQRGLDATCELIVSGCQGRCEYGPNMNIYPQLTKYEQLNAQKARRIVAEHLAGGQRVSEYMCQDDR